MPSWIQASNGPILPLFEEDAIRVANTLDKASISVEWPVVGQSGDIATLMGMVSNHEVSWLIGGIQLKPLLRSTLTIMSMNSIPSNMRKATIIPALSVCCLCTAHSWLIPV